VNRQQLEHVILEVGKRTGEEYFYIIGSAAIFASVPDASGAALAGKLPSHQDGAPALLEAPRWQSFQGKTTWTVVLAISGHGCHVSAAARNDERRGQSITRTRRDRRNQRPTTGIRGRSFLAVLRKYLDFIPVPYRKIIPHVPSAWKREINH
jgi:hypothetical protein